jgi:hypothetical protein
MADGIGYRLPDQLVSVEMEPHRHACLRHFGGEAALDVPLHG